MKSSIITLNGRWNYVKDSNEKLSYNKIVRLNNEKKSHQIKIPVNWELAGLHNYSGSVWFIKSFTVKNRASNLFIIEFNGVDYFTDAWLNGKYLGNHEGYFQKFFFDASDAVKTNGNNILVIKVSSPKEEPKTVWPLKKKLIKGIFNHHDCRPGGWSYQYGQDMNTGGIWNEAHLIEADSVYVKSLRINSRLLNNYKKVSLKITCDYYTNFTSPVKDKIELNIKTPSGNILKSTHDKLISKSKTSFDITIEIDNPDLWWSWDLGTQSLYELTVSGKIIPETKEVFGIREVKLDKEKTFFLNGRKLFLRGSNIIPTQFLSDLNKEKISNQVRWLKEANLNIVRMHAHVNRKEYYDECDKLGILVWQDFALQWTYDNSPQFITNASKQIKEMVIQHFNHPSIVFWCCHNEPGKQIETLDPLLKDSILSIDKSRIIRLASNYEEHPYDGWYWGNKEHFAATPMGPLVTEFGAQAVPEINSLKKFLKIEENSKPDWEVWKYHNFQYEQTFHIAQIDYGKNLKEFIKNSQQYQADLIKTAIDFYRRKKFNGITGIFQFMFIDCWPSITWSVIDYYGKKKKGFYVLQKGMQPVYISINVRQKKYFAGQKLNLDLWIINDLYETYRKCIIEFKNSGKIFSEMEVYMIDKNSVNYFNWESNNIYLPKNLKKGKHKVEVVLKNKSGKVLSVNDFEIEIVKKKMKFQVFLNVLCVLVVRTF